MLKLLHNAMNNNSETNWDKLDALSESEIGTSDISPLTEEFFNESRWWKPRYPLNAIEEILENFGLSKLMQEVEDDELLSDDDAYSYYQSFDATIL
jgi:RelB Antitoxin alpha helical domain